MKTLVIYYSRKGENYVNGSIKSLSKGNTQIIAKFIKNAVNADLFEIETVKQYNESYMTCIEEAKAELRENARPQLKNYLDDISGYGNIIVAGPCWWGTYPMAVLTQLERLDFTGKKGISRNDSRGKRSFWCTCGFKEILQGCRGRKRTCRTRCRRRFFQNSGRKMA